MAKGSLGCGLQTMKYFLFAVNLIFFFVGIGLIGAGIFVATEVGSFKDAFEGGNFNFAIAIPVVGITLGLFVLIGSFMGCLGALKENTCMIKTFMFFLVIVLLAEIGVATAVIVYNEVPSVQADINRFMKIPFAECVGKTEISAECAWLPTVQSLASCCGYDETRSENPSAAAIKAECSGKDAIKQKTARDEAKEFCNEAIIGIISNNLAIVAGVLGAIFFLEFALMVGTCLLIRGINSDNKYA